MHPPTVTGTATPPVVPTNPGTAPQPQMAMGQYGIPAQRPATLTSLGGALLNGLNPYTSSLGGVAATQRTI